MNSTAQLNRNSLEDDLPTNAILVMKNKLYFFVNGRQPKQSSHYKVVNVDNQYHYDGYNSDFGPFTLNYVHKFCQQVQALLHSQSCVVFHASPGFKTMANACFLLGAYLLICEKFSIAKIKKAIGEDLLCNLHPFRDAGVGADNFPITVIDCLSGLKRAM
jgi:hypothetical protein